MQKLVDNPDNVWEKKLNDIFTEKEETAQEQFLDLVSIILYNSENKDLSSLFSEFDFDTFIKIVHIFSGRTVSFPSEEEFKNAVQTALFFYFKEIKGIDTYDKLKFLNINNDPLFSTKAMGRKISKLKKLISNEVITILKDYSNGRK